MKTAMAKKSRKFKMKMIINAIQNNEYILLIRADRDFFAPLGKLLMFNGRRLFVLNTC